MQAIVPEENDLRVNCTANVEQRVVIGLKQIVHVSLITIYTFNHHMSLSLRILRIIQDTIDPIRGRFRIPILEFHTGSTNRFT